MKLYKLNSHSFLKLFLFLFGLTLFCFQFVAAQMPTLDWAKNITQGSPSFTGTPGSTCDPSGNVYTAGNFYGRQDFNPGTNPGDTLFLQGSIPYASFLTKLDGQGDFLWARGIIAFGASNPIQPTLRPVTDAYGNCYVFVTARDSAFYIDDGMGTLDTFTYAAPHQTYTLTKNYLIKFSPQGNLLWVKPISGSVGYTNGYLNGMITDENGSVYLASSFTDTVIFDPEGWNHSLNLLPFDNSNFICKIDSSGHFLWVKQFGKNGSPSDVQIAAGSNRTFYITGGFGGTTDFDPGSGTVNLSDSLGNIFLCKFDADGNLIWGEAIGKPHDIHSGTNDPAIATDNSGNLIIAGMFGGTVDFDPGPDTVMFHEQVLGKSFFIMKLNGSGNLVWVKPIRAIQDTSQPTGAAFRNFLNSVAVGHSGNVYFTGQFQQIMDFNPGPDSFNLTAPNGSIGIFVGKLDDTGGFKWAFYMGDYDNNQGKGMSVFVNDSDELYTTGWFTDTVDVDPGAGVYNLGAPNQKTVFIQKLNDNHSTGIKDPEWAKKKILLYPNPASSEVWLKNDNQRPMKLVTVCNVLGQVVFQQKINQSLYAIHIRNWASGLYFVKVDLENGKTAQVKFEIRR